MEILLPNYNGVYSLVKNLSGNFYLPKRQRKQWFVLQSTQSKRQLMFALFDVCRIKVQIVGKSKNLFHLSYIVSISAFNGFTCNLVEIPLCMFTRIFRFIYSKSKLCVNCTIIIIKVSRYLNIRKQMKVVFCTKPMKHSPLIFTIYWQKTAMILKNISCLAPGRYYSYNIFRLKMHQNGK